jgi:protein-S-isoprenylcysteine O-methyltransferase Ste14
MMGALAATLLPLGFLIVLFGGGAHFLRNSIEQDGEAPINRTLFYVSKYSILVLWGAMILEIWGIGISLIEVPPFFQVIGLVSWCFGFALLYIGRFEMGSSFRLGTPKEHTRLKVDGLFGLSRNPMYAGMYATIVAASLFTLNPAVIVLGAFVIAVHHSIVLAEENHLQKVFGEDYVKYRNGVRRYV